MTIVSHFLHKLLAIQKKKNAENPNKENIATQSESNVVKVVTSAKKTRPPTYSWYSNFIFLEETKKGL
jgi:hypothetical protein